MKLKHGFKKLEPDGAELYPKQEVTFCGQPGLSQYKPSHHKMFLKKKYLLNKEKRKNEMRQNKANHLVQHKKSKEILHLKTKTKIQR